jgi:fucose permease
MLLVWPCFRIVRFIGPAYWIKFFNSFYKHINSVCSVCLCVSVGWACLSGPVVIS